MPEFSEQELEVLFDGYVKSLEQKCDLIMWVVLDRGRRIMEISKEKHYAMVRKLLQSGEQEKIMVAMEVMGRSIGVWK